MIRRVVRVITRAQTIRGQQMAKRTVALGAKMSVQAKMQGRRIPPKRAGRRLAVVVVVDPDRRRPSSSSSSSCRTLLL